MGWFNDLTGIKTPKIIKGVGSAAAEILREKIVNNLIIDPLQDLFAADQPNLPDTLRGVMLNVEDNAAHIPVVYGARTVGGIRRIIESTGTDNEYVHIIMIWSEGEIAGIDTVYLDKVDSTDAKFAGLVRITNYLGTDSQAADPDLINEVPWWTANRIGGGIAYSYIRLKYNKDVFRGYPTITAAIRGKLVYDPRDSSTAYSNNNALCTRDYALNTRYGIGLPATSIDDADTIIAANYVETQRTPYTGAPTQNLFACDGVVDTRRRVRDNLIDMLRNYRAAFPWISGKHSIVVDAPGTSVFSFDEDNIMGAWSIDWGGKSQRYNRVTATYAEPSADYQDETVVKDSTLFRTQDNGLLLETRKTLRFVTDKYRATDICELEMKASRFPIAASFTATIAAMKVRVGQICDITHSTPGWTAVLFRVVSRHLLADGTVRVSVKQYDATSMDLTLQTEASTPPTTNLPDPTAVIAPTSLLATELTYEVNGGIELSWPTVADAFVTEYVLEFKHDGEATYLPGGPVRHNTTDSEFRLRLYGLATGGYSFRVRSINTMGYESAWTYTTGTINVAPLPPGVTGLELFGQANDTDFGGRDAKFTWRAASNNYAYDLGSEPYGGDSGQLDWYFKDYEVRAYNGSDLLRTEHTTDNNYVYSYEKNAEDYAALNNESGSFRSFTLEVYQRGRQNQISERAARLTVNNPAPVVAGLLAEQGFQLIKLGFSRPSDIDYTGLSVWMSTTSGFTPADSNRVFENVDATPLTITSLASDTDYYIRYAAHDAFGIGAVSDELTIRTGRLVSTDVLGLADWATKTDPLDKQWIIDHLQQDAVPSEYIESLVASKILSGIIAATVAITCEGLISSVGSLYSVDVGPHTVNGKVALLSATHNISGDVVFALYEDGTSEFSGALTITGGSGLANLSDANTSALTDDANLGSTADWSAVVDDDSKRPADNADVTLSVVNGGLELTGGFLKRGSDVALDFANKRIYINTATFATAGIQLEYNGGSPRAYIGGGGEQYWKYESGKMTIGLDTELRGVTSYNNSNFLDNETFDSLDNRFTLGNVSLNGGRVLLESTGSLAHYIKFANYSGSRLIELSFSGPETVRFKARIDFQPGTGNDGDMYVLCGDAVGGHTFGLHINGTTVRGYSSGSTSAETSGSATISSGGNTFEAIFTLGSKIEYFVNGISIGQLTSSLPTQSSPFYSIYLSVNRSSGSNTYKMASGEFRILQN